MSVKERILVIRILEKITQHPECAGVLGIEGTWDGFADEAEKIGEL